MLMHMDNKYKFSKISYNLVFNTEMLMDRKRWKIILLNNAIFALCPLRSFLDIFLEYITDSTANFTVIDLFEFT